MSTRAIDNNRDWSFGLSKNNYLTGQKEIEQNILTSILCWKNNCFFDMSYGISWYEILGSFGMKDQLKQELTSIILNIDGVVKINEFNYNLEQDRSINISINIDTIYSKNNIINQNIQV